MTSDYNAIYSRFFQRVTDYNFAGLEEELAKGIMNGWIKAVVSQPYVRRLFDTLTFDDELEEITYTLKFPVSDSEDQDFIEELITIGMVVQWLEPQVDSVLNTAQFFSNSEQKFYSQANHLDTLQELLKRNQNNLRKLIRDRGYIYNSYITEQ